MHIVHQSQLEIVERLSGVIARSIIPANLVFGPYDGVLSISSKTMDRKELDYILEVRSSSVWPLLYKFICIYELVNNLSCISVYVKFHICPRYGMILYDI